ncbi:Nucleus export protein brr6 [Pseudocercospora fuligena]|uniref:Nucleus export protein brr6 n=1 Tax=Pseudocercospora fuligena TaxID=685502 RepID=A0A8H6VC12_9PEZI|nr:Nucleus export protein brr6 [Pseudocercospora fuligena]
MSQRGNEMGMDFEWQNKTGAMDERSPFAQVSQNAQRLNTPSKRRYNTGFDSPSKNFASFASLQQSSNKPLPKAPAAFNSLYNTPRKQNIDIDDSSAGETPKSPERDVDSDATPDMGLRNPFGRLDAATQPVMPGAERERSPVKDRPQQLRRESWWGKIKTKMSPGRGEIARPEHSGAIEKRTKKKRENQLQRQASRRRRHSVSDSGEDSEMPTKSPRKVSGKHKDGRGDESKPHWISNLFTFIAQHPTVPHILSFYAQLAFNVFLLAGCGYLVYSFWSAVQGDVDKKSHEAMADIMAEMAECARQYTNNNCHPSKRMPALETVCKGWQRCMEQDPHKVGRAKVSAHTFAEIFNSFVEPISWKAMAFTFLLVFGCFATTNLAFGFFRDKSSQAGQQYPPNYYQPPPTPQRTFSNEYPQKFGTPWHNAPPLEPGPSGYAQIKGRGSPVRRLQYH